MSGAIVRAMLLGLVRDRGALVMSFLLPAVVFLIFAAIFAGATGEQMRLEVAMADEVASDTSRRLFAALEHDPALKRVGGTALTADETRDLVRRGTADVGLIARVDAQPLDSFGGLGPAPLLVVTDPVRGVAASMLAGHVQRAYFSALPDVALGSVVELLENEFVEFDETQRERIERGLAELRAESDGATAGDPAGFAGLLESEAVTGQSAARNHVAYYAGAIAVLFLLFSAVHGAITLLDERDAGIVDRILAGPGSTAVLVDGKFLFLVLQGFVQIAVIFAIAWIVHGVDVGAHVGPWALTTLVASAAAAGLALTLAAACRTRRQAQSLANVAILVLSALGGSMVPRFFMPSWLQDLGWITPNTWALEAYTSIFWRDEPARALLVPWFALAATAMAGWLTARRLARVRETL